MDYSLEERRRQLYQQIREWNQNRLDLFAISEPNQNLEFFGVMRFYYQDDDHRVSTKCIRVSSSANTIDVIHSLIEKFRPDLRMLSRSQYGLYEVHENGEERRLGERECPLLIQLHWGKDDREGRFLLKKETARTAQMANFGISDQSTSNSGISRRLSTKEKKRHHESQLMRENDAERLYHEMPDSNFTRSISNPEIVMERRRQAKLQRKLDEIHSNDWGPFAGGTLKIYGQSFCPEVPYKTLLLSVTDNAFNIVKDTLEKYNLEKENANDYCLVKVLGPSEALPNIRPQETVLNDYDCPLDILHDDPQLAGAGCITFHLCRRDDLPSLKGGNAGNKAPVTHVRVMTQPEMLPYLVEVNPDGTRPHDGQSFTIPLSGLEIGRERSLTNDGLRHLQLTGHDILPRHCIIDCHGNVVSVVPLNPDASVAVNNVRIFNRTVLEPGAMLLIGRTHFFQFRDPVLERKTGPSNNLAHLPQTAVLDDSLDLLPAMLELREEAEDHFLTIIITEVNISDFQFKLLPAYLMYLATRFAHGSRLHGNMVAGDRASWVARLSNKMVGRIYALIQKSQSYAGTLAFWMANASELLNFFSRDHSLRSQTIEAQDRLGECIQMAFSSLVHCLQEDLNQGMSVFFAVGPNIPDNGSPDEVITILASIMSLLLTTNVNAALTIQIFSQMFHFINMWLFNRLMRDRKLCTREWGWRLRARLSHVEAWSEKQGLELAAECHLAKIIQSTRFLELPKRHADDVPLICSSCFKLNSLQLRKLLENYIPASDEPIISPEFIERVVGIAQNTADETARNEGQEIRLLEDQELHLPFLMPDDGYSCEFVKGLLKDMADYVEPLAQAGICRLIINRNPRNPSGLWTVHFSSSEHSENTGSFEPVNRRSLPPSNRAASPRSSFPEVMVISFRKINNSLGLSIVAASGEGQNVRRIFIKSVVPNGAAFSDGRLLAGDELLEVDGQSLVGMTQEGAAAALSRTGQVVSLKVAKQSAIYYGLATQLGQPSPVAMSNVPPPLFTIGSMTKPSAVIAPGYVQPFTTGSDSSDILRNPHGSLYRHHPQSAQSNFQPNGFPNRASIHNYPPEHLSRSQPSLRHSEVVQQLPVQSSVVHPPSLGSADGLKSTDLGPVPTGGRYPRASFRQNAPVRSKSVPDFDQVDFGGDLRTRPQTGTLPREIHGLPVYHQGKSGADAKRPILYPSTKEVYLSGYYPPMRPTVTEKGPKPSASSPHRQYGRSGKQANTSALPRHMDVFTQPGNAFSANVPRSHPGNGQLHTYHPQGQTKVDGRNASAKGSSLARYPNVSGLNTIGLQDRPESHVNSRSHAAGPGHQSHHSKPDLLYASSSSHGYQGQSYNPNKRQEWSEEFPPPVPPPPANIYASVSKGSSPYVGSGPGNVGKGWSVPSDDPILRQLVQQKEPEYARIQPKTGTNSAPSVAAQSMTVSPWVREEKEKAAKRQEEEKRLLRADEIYELDRRANLSPDEVERLRRLKLEAEFDRRLEEVSNHDDPEDDTEMTPAGRAKLIRHFQQEYLQQRKLRDEEQQRQEKFQEANRQQWHEQRLQDFDRHEKKQTDIYRPGPQTRQTEELFRQQKELDKPRVGVAPQRPVEPEEDTYSFPRKTPAQVLAPQPPERNSSYDVYRTGNAFIPTGNDFSSAAAGGRSSVPVAGGKKSVSFQTEVSLSAAADNQLHSSTHNQPIGYRSTAAPATFPPNNKANVVNSSYYRTVEPPTPFTPGTDEVFIMERATHNSGYQHQNSNAPTPGVVGSQELYLDPRERIAAAKLANVSMGGSYMTPERMSFRDKMNHFATEAGEETVKDRSKISRVQQRLEADLRIQ